MKHTVLFSAVLGLVLLLASCAGAVPTPAESAPEATAVRETRTIVHAMGETEVAAAPQRVVVLDTGEIDNALALGANVVGAPIGDVQTYQGYLSDQLAGIADTGTISEPNLETILTLKPDLILGSKQRYAEIYDQLSAIAPTVFTESLRVPWQDNFRLHAEALDKKAEAEQMLTAYDARTAHIRRLLGPEQPAISIIRFRPGQVRLYLKSSYIGYILQDVGLPRPPAQDKDVFSAEISLEQIADVDADYIFVTGYAQDDSALTTFLQSALWQTLDAVQQNHVIDVDDDYWIAALAVQGANRVLDDLISILELEMGSGADMAAFPVTVEHKFGRTEIPTAPQRVVSLGYSEQDPILALGVIPVAVRDWFGGHPYGVWPWAQEALGEEQPTLMQMPFGTLNYELIASLQPDLIVATHSGITAEEYGTLAQIAPVLAQPAAYPDFGVPWQEQTRLIGTALGRAERAEELIAAVEAKITTAAAANPHFAQATVAWATPTGEGEYWVVGRNTPPLRFLTALGLQYPEAVDAAVGELDSAKISSERLDLIDVDVLIMRTGTEEDRARLEADAIYQTLAVAREDRTIFFIGNDPVYGALSFSTVLSLPFVVDELVPQIDAVLRK